MKFKRKSFFKDGVKYTRANLGSFNLHESTVSAINWLDENKAFQDAVIEDYVNGSSLLLQTHSDPEIDSFVLESKISVSNKDSELETSVQLMKSSAEPEEHEVDMNTLVSVLEPKTR